MADEIIVVGPDNSDWYPGVTGPTSATGPTVPVGVTGPTGQRGPTGPAGATGATRQGLCAIEKRRPHRCADDAGPVYEAQSCQPCC